MYVSLFSFAWEIKKCFFPKVCQGQALGFQQQRHSGYSLSQWRGRPEDLNYCNYAVCWLHGPEMTLKSWTELWEFLYLLYNFLVVRRCPAAPQTYVYVWAHGQLCALYFREDGYLFIFWMRAWMSLVMEFKPKPTISSHRCSVHGHHFNAIWQGFSNWGPRTPRELHGYSRLISEML